MFHSRRAARGGIALGALVIGGALIAALTGCTVESDAAAPAASVEQQVLIYPDVVVTDNIAYGPRSDQRLDVCEPADPETSLLNNGPRRAVVSVHGGSWREGDKASPHWRSVCEWLASEGFVAFSVNYALAPLNPFPAAITDVRAVIDWLRQPEQVATYGYDPAFIGAFGGSAGGNLVTLLGASGSGAWNVGTRVAAVVELSGPIDLGERYTGDYSDEFIGYQLDYLGCDSYDGCRSAAAASPQLQLDPSDPPIFVAHSQNEFIPVEQAELLVDALAENGIPHEYATPQGKKHSIAMLDDSLREQIVAFLREHL